MEVVMDRRSLDEIKEQSQQRIVSVSAAVILLLLIVCIFTPAVYAEDADGVMPDNGIPVVTVTIDEKAEGYGTIDEMNESRDHSVKCYGTVKVDVPEGFHYSDYPDSKCESVGDSIMEIRGRGNTTWNDNKKPYKIKLKNKASMLGFGKNKHWVLIANAYDRTLIKDRMTGWLGDAIGMEFTPRGVPVDVVMKNTEGTFSKKLGSYLFCENVRIDKNRIEINELSENDTEPDKITGGYLVQRGVQTDYNSPNLFQTAKGVDWATDTPDFDVEHGGDYDNEAQKAYIRKYMQDVEDALFSGDFDGEKGTSYRDLMDVESAAKYWLIDQLSCNGDGYGTGSTYVYKKEDTVIDGEKVPGKLYWGPLWDFDYAWGHTDEGTGSLQYNHIGFEWLYPMLYDAGPGGFTQEVRKQWPALKAALGDLTADGGIIDKYYEETARSQAEDHKINPRDDDLDGVPDEYVYKDEIDALKKWINSRTAWFDDRMQNSKDLETWMSKITLEAEGVQVGVLFKETGDVFGSLGKGPEKEGYTFIEWRRENGKQVEADDKVTGDITLYAYYLPDSKVTHVTDLFFRSSIIYDDINTASGSISVPFTVVPEDAQDKTVKWTSSDEEIATVDSDGIIRPIKAGTVIVTGTLKCGTSRSCTVVIMDGGVEELTAIGVKKPEITMKKGQYDQVEIVSEPERAPIYYVEFKSNNEKVVTVDDNGVLHSVGTGSAVITVLLSVEDKATGAVKDLTAKCNVYVTGANTMKARGKTVKIKQSQVKKQAKVIKRTKAIKITGAKGKVTYKLTGVSKNKYRKYFKVAKNTGKLTVKKGIRKGSYKVRIKVMASGDRAFKPASTAVTVKIRVK